MAASLSLSLAVSPFLKACKRGQAGHVAPLIGPFLVVRNV